MTTLAQRRGNMAYWFPSHSTPASISTDVKLVDLGTVDGAAKSAYMIDSTMILSIFTTGSESAALRDTAIAAVTRMKELWGMSIDAQVSALCVTSVPSITNAPFLYRCWLHFRSIGLAGANSTALCHGQWSSGGAVATAASETAVGHASAAAVSVDTTIANALWIGVTFSVAPSVVPRGHLFRSLN